MEKPERDQQTATPWDGGVVSRWRNVLELEIVRAESSPLDQRKTCAVSHSIRTLLLTDFHIRSGGRKERPVVCRLLYIYLPKNL
jgi:hypothetical protein